LLAWFGMEPVDSHRLSVVEANMDLPDLGLGRERYDELAQGIDEIIHCASNTSFSERKRKEVEKTNIKGLEHILALAVRGRCYFFHHVSTAYVGGKKNGSCKEEFVETAEFTNVYEETKYYGEQILHGRCEKEGIRLNVYRPSIVYGSSRDGRCLRFNALYYPLRTILFLKNLFMTDIKEDGGKKAAQMGVKIGKDGFLHLPLRLEAGNGSGINLIPVDFFVKAFMEIMDNSLEGGVFHIVNERSKGIDELAAYMARYFNLEGIEAVHAKDLGKQSRSDLEILFDTYVEAYKPYMRDNRVFRNEKTRSILEKKNITCPDLDYEVFAKCMQYAIDTGWGKYLFEQQRG
jgi:nucleoside-diphosphate-sugar epimerase